MFWAILVKNGRLRDVIDRSITFRNRSISAILTILLYISLLFLANLVKNAWFRKWSIDWHISKSSKSSIFCHFHHFTLHFLTVLSHFGKKWSISRCDRSIDHISKSFNFCHFHHFTLHFLTVLSHFGQKCSISKVIDRLHILSLSLSDGKRFLPSPSKKISHVYRKFSPRTTSARFARYGGKMFLSWQ